MKTCMATLLLFTSCIAGPASVYSVGGITPEQIYQQAVDWQAVIGTWEVLPEDNPLAERGKQSSAPSSRTLMTLRKDGTCRVFSQDHPMGSDGLWTFESHEMHIRLPDGGKADFFVYGVRGDFMVTRSPIRDGKDQLWSRVK